MIDVMERKLSQKEREENVTKGFLVDQRYATKGFLIDQQYVTKGFLIEQEYITRTSLEEILDSKNYVTKEYLESKDYLTRSAAAEMFEMFQKSSYEQMCALMEEQKSYLIGMFEALTHRDDRIEERVNRLELKLGM